MATKIDHQTITPELLDEATFELSVRDSYPDEGEMLMPMHLARRMLLALTWAADEIAQLREDVSAVEFMALETTGQLKVYGHEMTHALAS